MAGGRTLESDVNRGYGVVNRGSCVNIVIGCVYISPLYIVKVIKGVYLPRYPQWILDKRSRTMKPVRKLYYFMESSA